MKGFIKTHCRKAVGSVLLALGLLVFLTGCPSAVVDGDPSPAPDALVTTGIHAGTEGGPASKQKAVVFSLTSSHPADAIWKVYRTETGGEALSTVSASYDPATKKLTLTALENDLAMEGSYYVSVTERGRDESRRLALTVKFLYPLAITYDANGGVFGNGGVIHTAVLAVSGDTILSPANPTRSGFVFAGWNEESDGSGGAFPGDTALTGDVYVFAKWIGAGTPYTVTFHANGGAFPGNAETLEKTGTFTAGGASLGAGNMPSSPASPNAAKYVFSGWNTRADGLGTVFTGTTLINSPAVTVYAKWHWDRDADTALKLHHDFDSSRVSGTNITSRVPSAGSSLAATMTGTGGVTGSKTISSKTYSYYKTGPKLAMSAADVSYLNLGAGAGSILKAAASGYTIAAYVRIEGDTSGNGNFIWAFAETNNTTQTAGQAIWCSAPAGSHATTTGGWGSNAQSISKSGAVIRETWQHVAYTQDGTAGADNAKLYVNGVEVVKGAITVLPNDFSASLVFNTLGGPCFTADYNLSNTMFADFRIYDQALEEIQIRELASDLNVLNSTEWP